MFHPRCRISPPTVVGHASHWLRLHPMPPTHGVELGTGNSDSCGNDQSQRISKRDMVKKMRIYILYIHSYLYHKHKHIYIYVYVYIYIYTEWQIVYIYIYKCNSKLGDVWCFTKNMDFKNETLSCHDNEKGFKSLELCRGHSRKSGILETQLGC